MPWNATHPSASRNLGAAPFHVILLPGLDNHGFLSCPSYVADVACEKCELIAGHRPYMRQKSDLSMASDFTKAFSYPPHKCLQVD